MVKEMWIAQRMCTETKATEQNPRMGKRMQKHSAQLGQMNQEQEKVKCL